MASVAPFTHAITAAKSAARSRSSSTALMATGITSAALGLTAGWVAHRARRAEQEYPRRGAFVNVRGMPMRYLERGQGRPVVLLHGNVVHAEDFVASGLLDRLAQEHRVIAFDRPGFGLTGRPRGHLWTPAAQAELLREALATLGVTDAVVLGHSWGALVALELALQSTSVRKLILVSGYYFPTPRLDVAIASPAAIPLVGAVLRYTVSPLVARATLSKTVAAMFAPQPVPSNFLPMLSREMLVRPSQIRANAQDAAFMIPAAAGLTHRYADLTLPVSIFAGDADRVVDVDAHARRLHAELDHSELHVLPHVGHMAHYAALDEIAAAATRESRGHTMLAAARTPSGMA